MEKTLTIHEPKTKGTLKLIKDRNNSKAIKFSVEIDNEGFNGFIFIKDLKELIK